MLFAPNDLCLCVSFSFLGTSENVCWALNLLLYWGVHFLPLLGTFQSILVHSFLGTLWNIFLFYEIIFWELHGILSYLVRSTFGENWCKNFLFHDFIFGNFRKLLFFLLWGFSRSIWILIDVNSFLGTSWNIWILIDVSSFLGTSSNIWILIDVSSFLGTSWTIWINLWVQFWEHRGRKTLWIKRHGWEPIS